MTDIRRVGDSGVHTVEGNVAGGKTAQLTKQRERQKAQYEAEKNKIKQENAARLGHIDQKFNSASDVLEQEFRRKTVGLVTADDFRKARESVNEQRAESQRNKELYDKLAKESKQLARDQKRKKIASSLSFGISDDEDNEEVDFMISKKLKPSIPSANISNITENNNNNSNNNNNNNKSSNDNNSNSSSNSSSNSGSTVNNNMDSECTEVGIDGSNLVPKKKKSLKNPSVDTSFLPDAERERQLNEQREKLKQEWHEEQERMKRELLEVTYSYWDGSGHRKVITIRKGTTVGKFLELVKQQLIGEFHQLRSTNVDDFVYVKEDLIIPHHYSFYDLIVTKARGKSGPLFHFDVHDDVRLINDATVEKDESHPGKVAERRWYERNKHIFPASRWEVYDPKVDRGGQKYTIHGGEVAAIDATK